MNDLNAAVTKAILDAEEADRQAAKAWRLVAKFEQALVDALPEGLERDIATRGVESATRRAEHREQGLPW